MDEPRPASALAPPMTLKALTPDELRSVLGQIADELDRPLAALRAGLDDLPAPPAEPKAAENRDLLVGLCDGMRALIGEFVDYATFARGAAPLHLAADRLGRIVADLDRDHAASAAARGLAWECRLDGPDRPITTDPGRCRQLAGALIDNALKAAPPGGRVAVVVRGEPGATWQVEVGDDGPGIPAEELDRAFEPFYRLPGSRQAAVGDDGLGLAFARALADRLGGRLTLACGPGAGTRALVHFSGRPPG